MIVFQRFYNGLSNGLQAGKMNDRINRFIFKDLDKSLFIQHIGFIKLQGFSRDLFHSSKGFFTGIIEIVRNNNVIAGVEQLNTGMASNISAPPVTKIDKKISSLKNFFSIVSSLSAQTSDFSEISGGISFKKIIQCFLIPDFHPAYNVGGHIRRQGIKVDICIFIDGFPVAIVYGNAPFI